jgi:hypothetical protein
LQVICTERHEWSPNRDASGKDNLNSYTTDSWYLGVVAWVFIAAVIGYGTYIVDGLVRRVGRKVKMIGGLKFILR